MSDKKKQVMKTIRRKWWLLPAAAVLSLMMIAACSKDVMDEAELTAQASPVNQEEMVANRGNFARNHLLAQVSRATAKYQRVEVAIADGYVEASPCVYNEELGAAMGYHFVNEDLVDPFFDPLKPEALLYERGKNGKLKLVGVEYIVIDVGQPHPHFGDHPFDVGGTPVPVDHYSLHVWNWKHNPLGMYFPFNPNVSCN